MVAIKNQFNLYHTKRGIRAISFYLDGFVLNRSKALGFTSILNNLVKNNL